MARLQPNSRPDTALDPMAGLRYLLEMSLAATHTEPTPNQCQTSIEPEPGQQPDRTRIVKKRVVEHPPALRLAIKADYVHGLADLRSLSVKYGVPEDTIYGWSGQDNWPEQRHVWMQNQDRKLTQPKPEPEPQPIPAGYSLDPRARKVEEMIEQTEKAYQNTDEPREMQALATALDRLYQTWSLLTGHAKPAPRKAEPAKRKALVLPTPEPE